MAHGWEHDELGHLRAVSRPGKRQVETDSLEGDLLGEDMV